ncbi:diguanylate cyclase [Bacillus sp. RO3]|nr:diguanylate cyclase [Bacillus sp. RO3]
MSHQGGSITGYRSDELHHKWERCKSTIEGLNISHEDSLINERIIVSIGAAWVVPDEDEKGRKLIQAADEWLYEAKEKGRNRFYIKDLHSRAVEYTVQISKNQA